jgi:hypothetical protein
MMRVKMRIRKINSSTKRMANKRDSTREEVGKHTLLVISSLTLNLQVVLPQAKKMMRRSPPVGDLFSNAMNQEQGNTKH